MRPSLRLKRAPTARGEGPVVGENQQREIQRDAGRRPRAMGKGEMKLTPAQFIRVARALFTIPLSLAQIIEVIRPESMPDLEAVAEMADAMADAIPYDPRNASCQAIMILIARQARELAAVTTPPSDT